MSHVFFIKKKKRTTDMQRKPKCGARAHSTMLQEISTILSTPNPKTMNFKMSDKSIFEQTYTSMTQGQFPRNILTLYRGQEIKGVIPTAYLVFLPIFLKLRF